MRRLVFVVSLFTLLSAICSAVAQQSTSTSVPNLINYTGTIRDANNSGSSKVVGVTFAIYNQAEGGAPLWSEIQNVTVTATGRYSVLLGSTSASGLPGDLFSPAEQRWLSVKVEGQPEQPRVLLVSVPYAMKAAEADTLAGHSVSEFVTTDTLQATVRDQDNSKSVPRRQYVRQWSVAPIPRRLLYTSITGQLSRSEPTSTLMATAQQRSSMRPRSTNWAARLCWALTAVRASFWEPRLDRTTPVMRTPFSALHPGRPTPAETSIPSWAKAQARPTPQAPSIPSSDATRASRTPQACSTVFSAPRRELEHHRLI